MKLIRTVMFIVLLTPVMFLANSFAQDSPISIKADGTVNDIKYSPDGRLLAVATSKGLHLYDVMTLKKEKTLQGHTGGVNVLAFSVDGKTLASVDNSSLLLWNLSTGKIQKTIVDEWTGYWSTDARSFENPILALAFTQNDNVIIIRTAYYQFLRPVGPVGGTYSNGRADPDISYMMIGPDEVYTITTALVFSPNGEPYAIGRATVSGKRRFQKREDIGVTIQLPKADKEITTTHKDMINAMALSPDEDILASGSSDMAIHLIDVESGAFLMFLNEHKDEVTALAFSPDGKTLASGSKDGAILLSNVSQLKKSIHRQIKTWLKKNGYTVTNVTITNSNPNYGDIPIASNRGVTASDGKVTIWNMGNGKVEVSVKKVGSAIFIYQDSELQPSQ